MPHANPPKPRDFTAFDHSGKAPDLNTLGSDLYLEGEVMREKLSFPPAVLALIYSDENNPGAKALAQETILAPILAFPSSSLQS